MNLVLGERNDKTVAELFITYNKPNRWIKRFISFLFADEYCNWCLKNMLEDTMKKTGVQ